MTISTPSSSVAVSNTDTRLGWFSEAPSLASRTKRRSMSVRLVGVQALDRHQPIQPLVLAEQHGRHPARAEMPQDAVAAVQNSSLYTYRHRGRSLTRSVRRLYTRWISVPVPRPPPQHMVTSPISLSERSSSWSSVVMRRAPVEPSG